MKKIIVLLVAAVLLLTSCGNEVIETAFGEPVTIAAENEKQRAAGSSALQKLAFLLDPSNERGDIYKINSESGAVIGVSADTALAVSAALEYSELTGGAYDPTVYPLKAAWGLTGDNEPRVPADFEVLEALALLGHTSVTVSESSVGINMRMGLDLGAAGIGYAVDAAAAALESAGAKSGSVCVGGCMRAIGSENPLKTAAYTSGEGSVLLSLTGISACVSGGNRFSIDGVSYCRVLDPFTGLPASSGVTCAVVLCGSAARAGALSDALLVLGAPYAKLLREQQGDFEYLLILADGRVVMSPGAAQYVTLEGSFASKNEITG